MTRYDMELRNAAGVEPTAEAIRDRVYDRVEVRAEFSTSREEPLGERVANAVA